MHQCFSLLQVASSFQLPKDTFHSDEFNSVVVVVVIQVRLYWQDSIGHVTEDSSRPTKRRYCSQ
jgi:hypothetical protein